MIIGIRSRRPDRERKWQIILCQAIDRVLTPSLEGEALSASDQFEVMQLLSRYAFAIDTKDPDGVAGLFTEDGAFVSPIDGTARGRPAIRDMIAKKRERIRANPGIFKRHYITHPLVLLDGDRGTFQAGMLETMTEHGVVKVILTGHYEGVIRKESDGQWRFVERQCIPDAV